MPESKNAKQIRLALEVQGHTNVKVWWNPWGPAIEMCGPSGGYFYCSDQRPGEPPKTTDDYGCGEPIGLTFAETMERIHFESKYLRPGWQ